MLSFFRRFPLVAAVIIAAGCDRPDKSPTGPMPVNAQLNTGGADRYVDERFYDLSDSYFAIECSESETSELVAMQGQIFERFTFQFNPGDNVHVAFHTMPVGVTGVGSVSGAEYRVTLQESAVYNQSQMGSVGSYRQILKLVRLDSRSKYSLVGGGHYTINANGEIGVERDKLVLKCEE